MKRALQPVALTCALAITTLGVAAAPAVPNRPKSIKVYVNGSGITVDSGSPTPEFREKVWARAGGNVAFVIENLDTVAHTVRIPISGFIPSRKKEHQPEATAGAPFESGIETITVNGGEVGVITFRVKPASHFQFATREAWKNDALKNDPNESKGMTYKYTIYTLPARGKEIPLDPDIEIKP